MQRLLNSDIPYFPVTERENPALYLTGVQVEHLFALAILHTVDLDRRGTLLDEYLKLRDNAAEVLKELGVVNEPEPATD